MTNFIKNKNQEDISVKNNFISVDFLKIWFLAFEKYEFKNCSIHRVYIKTSPTTLKTHELFNSKFFPCHFGERQRNMWLRIACSATLSLLISILWNMRRRILIKGLEIYNLFSDVKTLISCALEQSEHRILWSKGGV